MGCGAWPHAAAPSTASLARRCLASRPINRATDCAWAAGQRRPSRGAEADHPPAMRGKRACNRAGICARGRGVYRIVTLLASRRLAPTSFTRKPELQTVGGGRSSIRSTTVIKIPVTLLASRRLAPTSFTRKPELQTHDDRSKSDHGAARPRGGEEVGAAALCLELGLCITDSACKNQLVVVSVKYVPFNTYIPIRSTTIGKSRVAKDPITMHTSRRSNSDIASVTRASMAFRVVRTNQYNQDLGLIHSTNGNHLESPNEGSSIDHQVTIHLHAQNITMFPTNETWYFTSQMLVSDSGGLILILTAQSTRNVFRLHSDYEMCFMIAIISTITSNIHYVAF
ncbi:triacylglycerol lipase [Dorcoceras hygrometricum]|uniref:Triacylglycerol lipase n=1 Tax=Dorcoceras hygrometricum TaxID=472368 RepID=A0A2Z7C157_9LAMI|nr:triacylglycerol lipase [Dorcoceras hygrometricum]